MRRCIALLAALLLAGSVAGSGLAAATPSRSFFSGTFELWSEDEAPVYLGRATAQLFEATDQRLVPGSWDFKASPDNWFRESHAQIGSAGFWHDPDHWPNGAAYPGADVAYGDGVECAYVAPNETLCHPWAVMLIDNLDPSVPNQAAFADSRLDNGEWDFQYWQVVGKGDFVVRVAGG